MSGRDSKPNRWLDKYAGNALCGRTYRSPGPETQGPPKRVKSKDGSAHDSLAVSEEVNEEGIEDDGRPGMEINVRPSSPQNSMEIDVRWPHFLDAKEADQGSGLSYVALLIRFRTMAYGINIASRTPSPLVFLALALVCLPMVDAVNLNSVMAQDQLNIITLNCNGLGENGVKLAHVYGLIVNKMRHVVVLTETRQTRSKPLILPSSGTFRLYDDIRRFYQMHHESAAASNSSTGITVLIRHDINVTNRILTPNMPQAAGRIAAVDLSFPDMSNRIKPLRIIGIYAPTRPASRSDSKNLTQFWDAVRSLTDVQYDWALAGGL